ncbi:MAG: tail fiber domain-containing protein, partial [Bacteroidia bacterium]
RLTAAGNLGIGSTAPNQKLDVVGAIRSTNYHYINHSSPSVVFQDTDERSGVIHVNSNLMYFLSGNGTNGTSWTQNGSYWPLYLNLNSDEAYFGGPAYFMEGSVGIGNNSPAYRLHVSGDIYANGGWLRVSGNQGLYFESHGTGIQSVEADGGQYGSVSTYGNEGGWDGYSIGGRYVWMAQDGGQQCGLYNDVDNYWYLLINRLATDNGYQFMNSYTGALNMRIQHTNGSRYASYDGDSNWDFYSDRRLKEHIENEENILDRLLKLDVVNYHFIDECKEEKEIGFIAQDVEQYFPSLVSEATDARYDFKVKTLGYSSFGVLAVGAIKELKIEKDEEVAGLNKKVTELLKEIESLKTENERIKAHFNTEIEIIKAALNSNNILIQSASTK